MSIPYKIVQKKNPQKPNDPALYYILDVAGEVVELEALAQESALISGTSQGDILNSTVTLLERIGYQLSIGNSVRLPHFGILSPSLTGAHGAATPEEAVRVKKEADVNFRPDQDLKDRLRKAGSTFTGDVTHSQPPAP